MLDEFNDFLEPRVSTERRMVLLEATRVLDSVLGAKAWVTIDNLVADNSIEPLAIFDEIDEAIIGSYYAVFLQFGITLNLELLDGTTHLALANALEALSQLELNEDRESILAALDFADDSEEALSLCLETVSPGTGTPFIELVGAVKPALLKRLKEIFSTPQLLLTDSLDAAMEYSKRLLDYRSKYELPAVIESLLDDGANLQHDPIVTLELVMQYLLQEHREPNYEEWADILSALVVYSNTANNAIVATTHKLCEKAFADELTAVKVEQALNSRLGGYGG